MKLVVSLTYSKLMGIHKENMTFTCDVYTLEAHTIDKITHVGNWDMKTISKIYVQYVESTYTIYRELIPRTNVFKACPVIEKLVSFVYTKYSD